ncbi:hypothetical protein [Deferribacter abyssi]|uniref:hypothetical protein n=1 Tax=Deferribacter abyssi TaxID=213806 RepID=UPI003C1766C4
MKVLQINIDYKQGSTGNIVCNIHNLLRKSGFESFVAYGRGDWDEDNVIKISNKFDFYLHALGTRVFDRHGLFSTSVTKNFIEKIDKLDIDVFHLHNIHGYYINYKILFDYLKKKTNLLYGLFMIVGLLQVIVVIMNM